MYTTYINLRMGMKVSKLNVSIVTHVEHLLCYVYQQINTNKSVITQYYCAKKNTKNAAPN